MHTPRKQKINKYYIFLTFGIKINYAEIRSFHTSCVNFSMLIPNKNLLFLNALIYLKK